MGWPVKHPSVIYAIRCTENGKVYIGCTYDLERRIKEHFSALRKGEKRRKSSQGYVPSAFQLDFNKYGESAFEVYIIKTDVPPDKRDAEEDATINEYRALDPEFGYNTYIHKKSRVIEAPVKYGKPPKAF